MQVECPYFEQTAEPYAACLHFVANRRDQELGKNGGLRLVSQPAPRQKKKLQAAKAKKSARPRQQSANEAAREETKLAIRAATLASEGPRRHFFWRHRERLLPFGAVLQEPRLGVDLPGEWLPPMVQPPYISVSMRPYQLDGILRFE